jgi:hypothetical protein
MSAQDQSPVQAPRQASPHDIIGVGLAFSATGLYVMLGAAGVLPMPENNSPWVIVFCAGMAFLFAGLTCMVRARAGTLHIESEAPDGARASKGSYRMLAIGAAGALAIVGAWIAIGSGPRAFGFGAPFVGMETTGEVIGRTVFGLGAVIVLIYLFALIVGTVRKLFDR